MQALSCGMLSRGSARMPRRTRKRSHTRATATTEWVGGRLTMPAYVTDADQPYRPEMVLWLELPHDLVVGTSIAGPDEPVELAATLRAAMAAPLAGPARRPDRVRVADPSLAAELRAAISDLPVVVAPTPELDAVLAHMSDFMAAGPAAGGSEAPSYLEHGRIAADAVERVFRNAARLYQLAPWDVASDGEVLRVDAPALGIEGGALCIIGALGESFGFLLFPSIEGYDRFLDAAEQGGAGPRNLGTTWLALDFQRGANLPAAMRREVARHEWPVAGPHAYPVVTHHDRDGIPRPLAPRDAQVAAACAGALAAFFARHHDCFGTEDLDAAPVSLPFRADDGVDVRLTLPYLIGEPLDAAPTGSPSTAPHAERNAPCPCGSGKKYKKCCLARDEHRAGEASASAWMHATDERLVFEMARFAQERFGEPWWDASTAGFDNPEGELQLFLPWSVYGVPIEGRPIADWFLDERRRRLPDAERSWLHAQRRAWLSVWEVTGVDPGRGVSLRDLLTGEERQVLEVRGSKTLIVRDTILGRVVDHDGISVLCGIHPRPLPPLDAAEVVRRVRGRLRRKSAIPAERLRDAKIGRYLIARWEDQVEEVDLRHDLPPRLRNTDGDELLLTTDHFTVRPEDRAALEASLLGMEEVEPPAPDNPEPCFTFVRAGNAMNPGWDNTILGSVRLSSDALVLETNSVVRADALRARLESICGALVRHVVREHSDPTALLARAASDGPTPRAEIDESPEVQQLLRDFRARHMAAWIDQPVPALGGKTPRQAAGSQQGRASLDLLLRSIEHDDARRPAEDRMDVDQNPPGPRPRALTPRAADRVSPPARPGAAPPATGYS